MDGKIAVGGNDLELDCRMLLLLGNEERPERIGILTEETKV